MQDHCVIQTNNNFTNSTYTYSSALVLGSPFMARAEAEYSANRTGPLTTVPFDADGFPSLSFVTNTSDVVIDEADNQTPAQYLPPGSDPTVITGFKYQVSFYRLPTDSLHEQASELTYVTEIRVIERTANPLTTDVRAPQ